MTDSVRRPHYFLGQMLSPDDFALEQQYHRDMRHLLNRRLGSGVVEGLNVSIGAKGAVTVTPGIAIDPRGREIVHTLPCRLSVRPALGTTMIDAVVTATWQEVPDSFTVAPPGCPAEEAFTRWVEQPIIAAKPAGSAGPDDVVLARITKAGRGRPVVSQVPKLTARTIDGP